MRFTEIVKQKKGVEEKKTREFIYQNFSPDLLRGLEQDDPDSILRGLQLLGISTQGIDLSAPYVPYVEE